jgi:hypothetical protein
MIADKSMKPFHFIRVQGAIERIFLVRISLQVKDPASFLFQRILNLYEIAVQ